MKNSRRWFFGMFSAASAATVGVAVAVAEAQVKPVTTKVKRTLTDEKIVEMAFIRLGIIQPGRVLSKSEMDYGISLLGLLPDGDDLETVDKLAIELAPAYKLDLVKWTGDKPEDMQNAFHVISSVSIHGLSDAERAKLLDFYHGNQWDENHVRERDANQRPSLVVNRLPGLVSISLAMTKTPVMQEEMENLKIAVTMRNRDAQRAYNYMVSTEAEMAGDKLRYMQPFRAAWQRARLEEIQK